MHRVTYSKEGLIKFISHLDLIRLWQRAFRRSGLSVKTSQGFSPHPLISFGPPLPVGVAALREMLDVVLDPGGDLTRADERVQHALPAGVRILDLRLVPESSASIVAEVDRATYEAELIGAAADGAADRVAAAKAAANMVVKKQTAKGERYRDIRPLIHELECGDGPGGTTRITFTVGVGETGNLNPYELLEAVLGVPGDRVRMIPVTRTALYASGDTSHNRPRKPALKRR